jgi:hypothetical protein
VAIRDVTFDGGERLLSLVKIVVYLKVFIFTVEIHSGEAVPAELLILFVDGFEKLSAADAITVSGSCRHLR